MLHEFIINKGRSHLVLIFAGWGMDANIFRSLTIERADLCVCYDYTSLDLDLDIFAPYTQIELYAWSMGVWAAATILTDKGLPITKSTAINGTHFPIDHKRGIAPEIFQATIDNVTPRGVESFYRRMCANRKDLLASFLTSRPQRSIDDLHTELIAIKCAVLANEAPQFCWDRVIIGSSDRIFTPANQIQGWQGVDFQTTEDAHLLNFKLIIDDK